MDFMILQSSWVHRYITQSRPSTPPRAPVPAGGVGGGAGCCACRAASGFELVAVAIVGSLRSPAFEKLGSHDGSSPRLTGL